VLLLSLTTIAVLAAGYLGVNSAQSVGESAQQISAEALRAQAEEYLRQVTAGDAQRNDLVLKRVQRDAENVAQYAAGIFERPDAFAGGAYWQVEDHMFTAPDGQYKNDETDVSSTFVPDFVDIDEELLAVLELGAYMDFVLVPTCEGDPNTVAVYLGTERETVQYHPNVDLGALVPPDFQVTQRPWYLGATPENNPERRVVWAPIYVDAVGQGLMVTAAAPVYTTRDGFIGVVGVDVTLKDLSANVEAARLLGGGYSFLVDETGHAIALPEQGYQDILGRSREPDEFGADLSEATAGFVPVLAEMMAGSTGFDTLEVGGRELLVAYAPLESTGWSLANVVETKVVLQAIVALQDELETSTQSLILTRILPVGGAILVVVVVIGLLLTNRLADPIRRLAIAAQKIGAGQWDAPLPRAGSDEIGVLSQAFASMSVQLQELMGGLEQRVAERTADLERRSIQLQTAAEVARDATAIRDVDQLLDETVHLISDRFGFYHAGVFLVDDNREYAVLRAVSSEGGRRMLERGHKLAVGRAGMVGHVTGTGEPRIALDVGEDAVHLASSDLPETRSEMALPLRLHGEVIGALDVQSAEEAAFSDEDVAVLQTVADQLAVAVENARLFQETQSRLGELSRLYGEYSAAAWGQLAPPERPLGYVYDRISVEPVERLSAPALDLALQRGEPVALIEPGAAESALAMPLKLRDQVIGVLGIQETDEARKWSSDEAALVEAVSEQVALALESARLFEEAQQRAREQQALARIAALASATLDLDELLARLVDETVELLGARIGVLLVLNEDESALVDRYLSREARLRLTPGEWRVPLASPGFEQSIFHRGGTYYTNQAQTDPNIVPAYRPYVETLGAENFCGVALRVRDRSVGEFYVVDRPEGFGQEQARLISTVVGYVANAIENARLFEETQERVEDLSALHRSVQAVSTALDLDVLTGKLVDEACRLVGADYGVLVGLDPATGGMQYFKTAGIEEGACPLTELPRGLGLLKLVLEGQTVRVDDVREHPSYGGYLPAGHLPIVSFMGLPLIYQNQVRGLLAVSNQANRPTFDQGDENLLGTFATQATVMLENARLFEQTQQSLRETGALYRASRAIGAAVSLEGVGQALMDYAAISGVDVARNLLFEHDEQGRPAYIVMRERWAMDNRPVQPYGMRLSLQDYPLTPLLGSNEPIIVADVLTDSRANEMTRTFITTVSGLRSFAMVPITVGEHWIGMVFVGRNEPSTFTEEFLRGYWTLAGQAAVAIQSIRLLEETQQRAEQLGALTEVGRAIGSVLDRDKVLRLILERLDQVVPYDTVSLWLQEGELMRIHAVVGLEDQEGVVGLTVPTREDALFRELISTKQPLIIADVQQDERFRGLGGTEWVHSWLGVPLLSKGEVIGLLTIDKNETGFYTPETAQLALAFGQQAAIAIENARLFEEAQRRAHRERLIRQVTTKVWASTDLEDVLKTTVQELGKALGTSHALVRLGTPLRPTSSQVDD